MDNLLFLMIGEQLTDVSWNIRMVILLKHTRTKIQKGCNLWEIYVNSKTDCYQGKYCFLQHL